MHISGVPSAGHGSMAPSAQVLGKDDFLRLLVTQLQNQNPLEPLKDREFVSQMAEFSALEQMQNVATGVTDLSRSQASLAAIGLVGKTVAVLDADGNRVSGLVSSVRWTANGVVMLVNDQQYPLSSLVEVAQ